MKKQEIVFRYHPDPLETGSFAKGDTTCNCCGQPTDIFYRGPFYAVEDNATFCPACIASGKAARKYDGCFTAPDYCDDIGNPDKADEICYRTPGYNGIQQERWIAHCGDYCAYWGEVSYNDLTDELRADFAETWDDRPQKWDFEMVCGSLGMAFDGYLFQCLNCGKYLLYVQRD